MKGRFTTCAAYFFSLISIPILLPGDENSLGIYPKPIPFFKRATEAKRDWQRQKSRLLKEHT